MRTRKEPGQRRKGRKWQMFVRVDGTWRSKSFALETPIELRRQWRDQQIAKATVAAVDGSLRDVIGRYLAKPAIARRTYIGQVAAHLTLWVAALGSDRALDSIATDEIEAVIQTWLASGLSPVTVYHRRTSLRSLFVTMTGSAGPLTGTTVPVHEQPIDRSVPFATAAAIVDAMPDHRYVGKGLRQPSLAKLCARVMLHAGIPYAELDKLRVHHFDAAARTMRMPWRDKGKGTPAHVRQLSDDAVAAFLAIDAAQAWGRFPPEETVSRSFKRSARRRLGRTTLVRYYDLRHSLGADTYRETGDEATVGRLLGHAPGSKVTARYSLGAHAAVDRQALARLTAARTRALGAAARAGNKAAPAVPAKVARAAKGRVIKRLRKVS